MVFDGLSYLWVLCISSALTSQINWTICLIDLKLNIPNKPWRQKWKCYIDGSENLSSSTQNVLVEMMHFGEKKNKNFCRVRPAMGSAGWKMSAAWSKYALSIPSAWVSSLAQCKSKNPFSLQRAWARLPLKEGYSGCNALMLSFLVGDLR